MRLLFFLLYPMFRVSMWIICNQNWRLRPHLRRNPFSSVREIMDQLARETQGKVAKMETLIQENLSKLEKMASQTTILVRN